MLTNILYGLIFIAAFALGLWLFAYYALRPLIKSYLQKQAEKTKIIQADPLLMRLNPQKPALIYFTAEYCVPCKTMQRPAIERLQAEMNDLQVITIDAQVETELAERWGVLGVPRTFIVGLNHYLYASNMDVTLSPTLKSQIEAALAADGTAPMQIFKA